jgi:hypothetical protein
MTRFAQISTLALTLLLVAALVAGCNSGSSSSPDIFGSAVGGLEDDNFGLTADPEDVVIDTSTDPPGDSGTSMLTATVLDPETDQPLEGVEVTFTADGGVLTSGGVPVLTVADGTATDQLTITTADADAIEVTATEGFAGRSESVIVNKIVILPNQAPVADAGMDIEFECDPEAEDGDTVTLDGSASTDPDSTPDTNDDIVSFEWFEDYQGPAEVLLGEGETLDVSFDVGSHVVTLVVTDSDGATSTDEVMVDVLDTTPPEVSLNVSPHVLWPPNHKMVDITAEVDVTDCSDVTIELVSVTSNEPPNDTGDGNTEPDILGVDGGEDYEFQVRAERSGGGSGRVYTVVYRVTDAGGLTSESTAEIVVPHDQGGM